MITPPKNLGISPVNYRSTNGYYVRLTVSGSNNAKLFSTKKLGGKKRALEEATKYRNGLWKQLSEEQQKSLAKPKRKTLKSGVTNIQHSVTTRKTTAGKVIVYNAWKYLWKDNDGVKRTKTVSFGKKDPKGVEALKVILAIKARIDKYTSRKA